MSSLSGGGSADAFALVAYLPEPLAGFVDRLRNELAPGCRLRAHITILPPRQFGCHPAIASRELQARLSLARPFSIQVQEIKVFRVTDVVYLSIGAGAQELRELHGRLNQGPCLASEAWAYEPHITLAQELPADAIQRAREVAERRWREYTGPREFMLDKISFVQGSCDGGWVDLESWELHAPALAL